MPSFKRIVDLPHELIKSFEGWSEVRECYLGSCHCTSIMTDLESYIEVEALELDCLEQLCKSFQELGFEISNPEPRKQRGTNENSTLK